MKEGRKEGRGEIILSILNIRILGIRVDFKIFQRVKKILRKKGLGN